jgi:CxxC-x17-CxxC domain-containing protein
VLIVVKTFFGQSFCKLSNLYFNAKIKKHMEDIKKTCSRCGKDFLVIKQEQEFLTKMGLPFPNKCPSCRQMERLKARGERQLYRTTCQKCGKNIIVTYNPTSVKSQILCKTCYLAYFEKEAVILPPTSKTS